MENHSTMSRRGQPAVPPAGAIATAPDPVLRAIEIHRRATMRVNSLPHADIDRAGDKEWAAYWAMLETAPTTVSGFVALFEYLAFKDEEFNYSNIQNAVDYWSCPDHRHPDAAAWMAHLAAALKRLAAEPLTEEQP